MLHKNKGDMSKQTVTINGKVYDQHSGMPLGEERSHVQKFSSSQTIHSQVQKSSALNRRYVHKDQPAPRHVVAAKKQVSINPAHVSHSPSISHFAPHPAGVTEARGQMISDIGPVSHPIVDRAMHKKLAQQTSVKPKTAEEIKSRALSDAMQKATPRASKKDVRPRSKASPMRRRAGLAAASLALIMFGGYLTYLNMPGISVRVAAAQAGINASYPSYRPSGYSLSGPVAYQQGIVSMKFAANGSPQSYSVAEQRSGWDSSAVLQNYVTPKVGNEYTTTEANGLTIYSYGTNAAWVNDGILYTITGNAPLSSEQVQRIATSM